MFKKKKRKSSLELSAQMFNMDSLSHYKVKRYRPLWASDHRCSTSTTSEPLHDPRWVAPLPKNRKKVIQKQRECQGKRWNERKERWMYRKMVHICVLLIKSHM